MQSLPQRLVQTNPDDNFAIRRIRIEKLFGRYTYDLKCDNRGVGMSKLLILYGDNGSGKTTILKLVFNLLTHIDGKGHKTYLAHTRFRKFVVDLGKDTQVVAHRRGRALVGTFRAYVKRRREIVSSIEFKTDKENDIIRPTEPHLAQLQRFLKCLGNLKLALFFVTDDRQLLQNVFQTKEAEASISPRERVRPDRENVRLRYTRPLRGRHLDAALAQAIRIAIEWTKEQVLTGSKQGEADANTIYAEIVRRLASVSRKPRQAERTNIRKLMAVLTQQAARSAEFAKFGFPSALNIKDLIKSLGKARYDLPTIQKIVEPFVDSTKAKLDALQEVQDSVSGFVDTLNSFFKDKRVEFDLRGGILVRADDRTILSPSALSSGEKQLLLLFCNTLVAKDEATVFLIDEPEISLNIKWQRNLIRSLLTSTKKRQVQFILATHSFELFAPHEKNVLKLVNLDNANTREPAPANDSGTSGNTQI